MRTLSFLMVLAAIFVIFSCQKEEEIALEKSSKKSVFNFEEVKLIDERLVFNSQKHFEEALSYLYEQQNQDGELYKSPRTILNDQIPKFESIHQAYENISEKEREKISATMNLSGYEDVVKFVEIDGEIHANPIIDDRIFSSLINKSGVLQIGEKYLKIANNSLFEMSSRQFKEFNNSGLKIPVNYEKLSTITTTDLESATVIEDTSNERNTTCRRNTGSNRYRMEGKTVNTNYGVYREVKTRTIHQKRVLGVWWQNQTERVRLSGTVNYSTFLLGAIIDTSPEEIFNSQNWAKEVHRVVDWATSNTGTTFTLNAGTRVSHEVRRSGTHSCTTTN